MSDGKTMEIAPNGGWVRGYAYGWSPHQAVWIADYLAAVGSKETPVHDLGCGPGNHCAVLIGCGFTDVTGYEYSEDNPRVFDNIKTCDLALPLTVHKPGHVITLEVGEHIPAEHENQFVENVVNAVAPGCKLLASWAPITQGGIGHINQRSLEYVTELFTASGLTLLPEATAEMRAVNCDGCPWFTVNPLVFERMS